MSGVEFDRASRARLGPRDKARFDGETLFARIARVVAEADCVPRKELFESWEVARRIRRLFRGGEIVELACGHALVAHLLVLLDDTSPGALAVDRRLPKSAPLVAAALARAWPRLRDRVRLVEGAADAVEVPRGALVVSVHACGALTDEVLDRALAASSRVAVLPCCHDAERCDPGGLDGWMDVSLAIDATRVARLRAAGYRAKALSIPAEITQKNRLIVAEPAP